MRLRSGCLLFVGMSLVLFGVFVVVVSSTLSGTDTDCSTVRLPTAARFTALPPADQVDLIGDLEYCGRYEGRTKGEIEAALGAPVQRGTSPGGAFALRYEIGGRDGPAEQGQYRPPDVLFMTFDDAGRVAKTNIQHYTGA